MRRTYADSPSIPRRESRIAELVRCKHHQNLHVSSPYSSLRFPMNSLDRIHHKEGRPTIRRWYRQYLRIGESQHRYSSGSAWTYGSTLQTKLFDPECVEKIINWVQANRTIGTSTVRSHSRRLGSCPFGERDSSIRCHE